MGAVFRADKQLLKFQTNYYREEQKRREKIMDEAAERGLFLEDESLNSSRSTTWKLFSCLLIYSYISADGLFL